MSIKYIKNSALCLAMLLCLCAALAASGCGSGSAEQTVGTEPTAAAEQHNTAAEEVPPWELRTCTLPDGRTAFDITAEQFIQRFNAVYAGQYGQEDYLRPLDGWLYEETEAARFGGKVCCYRFKEDNEIWTLGSITLYTAPNDGRILELTVDFDDHGLSESLYRQFRENSLCALFAFYPELDEEQAAQLFDRMYVATDDIITTTDYKDGAIPTEFYYQQGGAGVYPYFAYGEFIHICIAPAA